MESQSSPVELLFEKVKDYGETRIDLLRLKAIDKSSSFLSLLIGMIIIILVGFISFIMLSVGLALLLGELLGKAYYGFFIVAEFYLIAGLVLYSSREKLIKLPMANAMIKKLTD